MCCNWYLFQKLDGTSSSNRKHIHAALEIYKYGYRMLAAAQASILETSLKSLPPFQLIFFPWAENDIKIQSS